ncbi:MAG TPA: lysylphosphatidylglycerol synthase transmembrane domain-containing protein [Polyangia bacterium]
MSTDTPWSPPGQLRSDGDAPAVVVKPPVARDLAPAGPGRVGTRDRTTGRGRLVGKIVASLLVTIVCVAYVLRGVDRGAVLAELKRLTPFAVGMYGLTLALTHLFRAWRWEFLLRPLGVSIPMKRLLPISSVGFMAILALPLRLGELVRPYFVARAGHMRMSAALGTVAVERIIDGLAISLLFFGAYVASSAGGDSFPAELGVAAWLSLLGFVGLTGFLVLALIRTDRAIALGLWPLRKIGVPAGRREAIGDRIRSVISGFRVLGDGKNLPLFLLQTALYWGCNGVGMWLLARQLGLPISVGAAFATMAFTGVVLTLPNAPGLVGQFHAGVKLALLAYLPAALVNTKGVAYAVVLHGLQTVWYVVIGLVSLPLAGGRAMSLGEVLRRSKEAADEPDVEPAQ